jgi:hypothetical protein
MPQRCGRWSETRNQAQRRGWAERKPERQADPAKGGKWPGIAGKRSGKAEADPAGRQGEGSGTGKRNGRTGNGTAEPATERPNRQRNGRTANAGEAG